MPPQPTPGSFGERLRGLRAAAGLTQEELAERAGRTVDVVVDCPDREPYTTQYNPLNTNAAEGEESIPEEPYNVLAGSTEYLPMNGGEGDWVSWAWSINRS